MPLVAALSTLQWLAWRTYRWWSSRQGRYLLRGIPALLVAGGCGYLAVAGQIRPPEEVLQKYTDAARAAMEQKDFAAAAVLWDRTLQFDNDSNETQFQLALAVVENDDMERFNYLMARLAPTDRAVHAPAHLLQAKRILGKGRISRPELGQAEAQLLQTIHLQPLNSEAHALLGQLCLSSGRPDLAEPHLAIAIRAAPALQLSLAKAHSLQGHVREAERFGKLAEDYFHRLAEKNPSDLQSRLNWAEALMFLDRYPLAAEVLRQGMIVSEDRIFRTALTRVYIAWSDTLARQPGADPAEKYKLLEAGLQADPNEMLLFDRIMKLLQGEQQNADEVRKSLVELLAKGEAPALIHLLLGTEAGERGDTERALYHLKRAHEIDSRMSIVANNLAWYMAHSENPDLSRALTLIESILHRWPSVPEFRDTRGEILLRMERWDEAQADLEAALPALRNNRRLHMSLAKVYRQLKLADLASEHERIAAGIGQEKAEP